MSEGGVARPARPTVPLVLWGFLATLVAERAALDSGFGREPWHMRGSAVVALGGLAVLLVALAVVAHGLRRHGRDTVHAETGDDAGDDQALLTPREAMRTIAVLAVCAGAGSVVASLACARQLEACKALSHSAVSSWELTVVSDASPSAFGYRQRVRARTPDCTTALVHLSTQVAYERGQVVRCVGRYRQLSEDAYGRSVWRQGVVGSVLVVHVQSVSAPRGFMGRLMALRSSVMRAIEPDKGDGRALLAGLVCGSRTQLDETGLTDVFATCGVAHLIAVSGSHLALLGAMLARLLEGTKMSPRWRLVLLALATGLFVLLCGAPPSAVRAWLMSLCASGSQVVGRRSHGLSSVGVVALIMVLTDPYMAGQLGFLLSVCSVSALCLFARYASYVMAVLTGRPQLPRGVPRSVRTKAYRLADGCRDLLAATLVCQLATLPLAIASFGCVSVVAPLTNVALSPLMGGALAVGMGAAALQGCAMPRTLLLAAFDRIALPVIAALRALARWPFASVALSLDARVVGIAVALGAVVLLAWWPRPSRRHLLRGFALVLCLTLVCMVRWRYFAPARIVVLDVGQGDAILVQEGSSAVLVDAGPPESVAPALARNHVLHLDAVVITHLHDDHYGGVPQIAESVPCSRVVVAEGVTPQMPEELLESCKQMTGSGPVELSYGDTLVVGGFSMRMVWPCEPVAGTTNPDSIELLVTYERGPRTLSALLTGDAEELETSACVACGDVGKVDLLKVGHHGSEVSLNPALAAALAPVVAVASAGEGNEYGHPRMECVTMLEDVGARFLCTIEAGDVSVYPSCGGVRVRCQK